MTSNSVSYVLPESDRFNGFTNVLAKESRLPRPQPIYNNLTPAGSFDYNGFDVAGR
jgi:hypothetical protein